MKWTHAACFRHYYGQADFHQLPLSCRRNNDQFRTVVPYNTEDYNVPGRFRAAKPMPYFNQFIDLETFQSLPSNLISPRIKINSVTVVDKQETLFTAPMAWRVGCPPTSSQFRNETMSLVVYISL
jgi:hypothetical protein